MSRERKRRLKRHLTQQLALPLLLGLTVQIAGLNPGLAAVLVVLAVGLVLVPTWPRRSP